MDDFLTEPWFIVLLGSVLALMMLSFGAMVFVKRKHMLLKQGALGSIRGKFDGEKKEEETTTNCFFCSEPAAFNGRMNDNNVCIATHNETQWFINFQVQCSHLSDVDSGEFLYAFVCFLPCFFLL